MEPTAAVLTQAATCPVCHQAVLPAYYFCPNCGTQLQQAPLATDVAAQVKLYLFSIILPVIAFLFVTRWQGQKYFRSKDKKANQIGQIAWTLLILSTIVTIWGVTVWTQNYIQETVNGINSDFGSYSFSAPLPGIHA